MAILLVLFAAGAPAQEPCGEPRPLALFAGGDLSLDAGYPCLEGEAHANGTASTSALNDPAWCPGSEGTVTMGGPLPSPRLRVDPDAFPDCTYYYVTLAPGSFPPYCRILARDGITELHRALGDSLTDVIQRVGGEFYLVFGSFSSQLAQYFDPNNGIFRKDPGDAGVVVNFAPAGGTLMRIRFLGNGAHPPLNTSIINARFVGTTEEERRDPGGWQGGQVGVYGSVTFEPTIGFAILAGDLQQSQSNTSVGTAGSPALCFVTGDVSSLNGQVEFRGALVALGNVTGTGGPSFVFDPGFFPKLPQVVRDGFEGTCWLQEGVAVEPVTWSRLKRRAEGE